MDTEQACGSPRSVESLERGRVLVVVRPGDEAVGCAGALCLHRDRGDQVMVLSIAGSASEMGARGASGSAVAPGPVIGYPAEVDWVLGADGLYSETLIGGLAALVDVASVRYVYAASPYEVSSDRRQLGFAVAEAIRRGAGACEVAFFAVDTSIRPNRVFDISSQRAFKYAALAKVDALRAEGQLVQVAEARDAALGLSLQPPVAAAEGFMVIDAEQLRSDAPGGPNRSLAALGLLPREALPLISLPLISVIVRTLGRPELSDALASVAAQTYPNLEVVVVHASPGTPLSVPERVGHACVRVVSSGEPLRRSGAANFGLAQAKGDFLAFLDDDDWLLPDHFSVLAGQLIGAEEKAVYGGVRCVRRKGDDWEESHLFNEPFDGDRLLVDNFIPIHSVLFSRDLYDQGCRFDESLDVYEDWDFWLQVRRLTPLKHEPRVTAVYRLASGTGFGVMGSEKEVEDALSRFFSKWRGAWTEAEFDAVVQRARSAQGIEAMQRQVAVLAGQRDQLSDLNQLLRPRLREVQSQLEQVRGDYERLHRERESIKADLRAEFEGYRLGVDERLAVVCNERDTALNRLDEVYRSTSWRVSLPVRAVSKLVRAVRRAPSLGLQAVRPVYRLVVPYALRRRLAPAASRLVAQMPLAEVEVAANGQSQGLSWGDEQYQPRAPIDLIKVKKGQFADCAARLELPTSDSPEVSVIMPVYKNLTYTLECLSSIAAHPPRTRFELVLIDDASGESDCTPLRSIRGIRLIENEENLGFLRSCNKAAAAARGRYLLFLNNDTQVRDGWLDALIEPFADPDVGMTGSKLLYPSGHLQEAGVCMAANGTARLVGLNGNPTAVEYNGAREVDYCSGASFMLERAVFEQLGGFDERFAPAYFEDADLAFQVRALGRKILYQPASEIVHHLSVTTGAAGDKLARIETNRVKFLDKWQGQLAELDQVRLISFYLPQFHPIPENDAWWGKGFTEWTNVSKARPNFEGHYQPQLPTELGFYDLRLPEVRAAQAEMARAHGVHGFCYYYYWFNGHRLLNRPLDDMLASGEPDFPFCVCWANENWSRRWDGREADLLMEQHYSEEDDRAFIRALMPALSDRRYIRINGRPLLLVYRASLLPDSQETTDRWREECTRVGLPEPYLACVYSFREGETRAPGFDAAVEFPPHGHAVGAPTPEAILNPDFKGRFYDYPSTAKSFVSLRYPGETVFRGVMPAWDNTARRQNDSDVFLNASPEVYEQWLRRMIAETREQKFGDERVLFINAWNEWAEGNHLEPDSKFGSSYLEATRRALDAVIPPRSDD